MFFLKCDLFVLSLLSCALQVICATLQTGQTSFPFSVAFGSEANECCSGLYAPGWKCSISLPMGLTLLYCLQLNYDPVNWSENMLNKEES